MYLVVRLSRLKSEKKPSINRTYLSICDFFVTFTKSSVCKIDKLLGIEHMFLSKVPLNENNLFITMIVGLISEYNTKIRQFRLELYSGESLNNKNNFFV